ncbi:MAG: hypothetical protein Q9182_005788 [Xanthomendoza sp. 2 TL-2023]
MAGFAVSDWTTRLDHFRSPFAFPEYPGLSIIVIAKYQPLERRVVLWGLASLMNHMVRRDQFVASHSRLNLRGLEIGAIEINFQATAQDQFDDLSSSTFSRFPINEGTNTTAAATPFGADDFVDWEFEFHGTTLHPTDMFLGTIGSIVQAAEYQPGENFRYFLGHWQQRFVANYRCFQIWMSISNPSILSKKWLLQSMVQSVHYAMQMRDYRELKVLAKTNGQPLWQGGFARTFGPELSANVSSF